MAVPSIKANLRCCQEVRKITSLITAESWVDFSALSTRSGMIWSSAYDIPRILILDPGLLKDFYCEFPNKSSRAQRKAPRARATSKLQLHCQTTP